MIVIVVCLMDGLRGFGITNFDRVPRFGITMGSVVTFWNNYWIGYHVFYANYLGLGSMEGLMTCQNCVS